MCPASVRYNDRCSGHDCWPPRPNNQGSPTVFVNDRPVHRLTDSYEPHCCGIPCHGGVAAEGSPNVFCEDLPKGRVGDAVSCGSVMAEGSPDVFIND